MVPWIFIGRLLSSLRNSLRKNQGILIVIAVIVFISFAFGAILNWGGKIDAKAQKVKEAKIVAILDGALANNRREVMMEAVERGYATVKDGEFVWVDQKASTE